MNHFVRLNATVQTLGAVLYADERIICQQDGVGLYDGKFKDPKREEGRVYLTNCRLIYIDSRAPHLHSVAVELALVRQTEFWIGFMKSSAKITLAVGELPVQSGSASGTPQLGEASIPQGSVLPPDAIRKDLTSPLPAFAGVNSSVDAGRGSVWQCRICGMRNTFTKSNCSLCGVSREAGSLSNSPSSSTGVSRTASPSPLPPPPPVPPSPQASMNGTSNESSKPRFEKVVCPTCTFLNHPSMSSCEMCDTPLASPAALTLSPDTLSRSSSKGSFAPSSSVSLSGDQGGISTAGTVRFSFRAGGGKPFYQALKLALAVKEWSSNDSASNSKPKKLAREGYQNGGGGNVGIDGLMRGITMEAQDREGDLSGALKDLSALMANAKEMITLAKSLSERMSQKEANTSPGGSSVDDGVESKESSLVRKSLISLGVVTEAITPDMIRDEQRYHDELAKELGRILNVKGGIMKDGIVGLDVVWCLWCRVRGIALVSPKDLRLTAPLLSKHTNPPILLRQFKSGLTVLHTPRYTIRSFSRRVLEQLDLRQALAASFMTSTVDVERPSAEREGISTLEVAQEEGIALLLAKEMLMEVEEQSGDLVRDEQGQDGIRWYRNYIKEPALT